MFGTVPIVKQKMSITSRTTNALPFALFPWCPVGLPKSYTNARHVDGWMYSSPTFNFYYLYTFIMNSIYPTIFTLCKMPVWVHLPPIPTLHNKHPLTNHPIKPNPPIFFWRTLGIFHMHYHHNNSIHKFNLFKASLCMCVPCFLFWHKIARFHTTGET